jgi:hypothetical protein
MPQFGYAKKDSVYVVYSFTTGELHTPANDSRYDDALKDPEKAFEKACEERDWAFAAWIVENTT